MKILVAIDTNSYSAEIINDASSLAANTWSDVTIMAVQPMAVGHSTAEKAWIDALFAAQEAFFQKYDEADLPYVKNERDALSRLDEGTWKASSPGTKELSLLLRQGDAVKAILAEAKAGQYDLIILGCDKGQDCQWAGEVDLPQRVARDAECSVLVVKEEKIPEKIVCCLDQSHVSQESLEMINQVVTLHGADLKIVGLTGPKGLPGKGEVEKKMQEILYYYSSKKIHTLIKLVDGADLEDYVAAATREGMVALWMGKKSLLGKLFTRDIVGRLVATSHSSVLILR